MKTIFNISMCAMVAYFIINWVADNPQSINTARQAMNKSVKNGKEKVSGAITK